ncbi:hypothetical protein INT46_007159, partial [Mucor plumbeus]
MLINEYSDVENNNSSNEYKAYKSYEIEEIVSHKLENNAYQFFAKWKDYPENDNSWIKINSFNEK